MIGHLYLLSENVHWLKGFRVGPTSIKCCKVYELSASFQLWLLDEFRCRKRIPNRTQCVLGSASVADVKRSENKLYNTMNDETIMKCNHNLLHEQNWLITRPVHKFRKFLLPVDFPKEERDLLPIDALLPCHVCQRWHYDIQTGQQATSKQTILGYVIYVQCCSMIQQRLETVAWSWQVKHCVSGICTTDLWRIIKDINTSSYRPWFLVWPWVAKFVFSLCVSI